MNSKVVDRHKITHKRCCKK